MDNFQKTQNSTVHMETVQDNIIRYVLHKKELALDGEKPQLTDMRYREYNNTPSTRDATDYDVREQCLFYFGWDI